MVTKYFKNPFGIAGDLATIPDNTQPGGFVSYEQGFPVNYELDQSDPSSLNIPRDQTNQLFNDITTNIQQYQQVGVPNFITSVQNGGLPFSYQLYAMVTYNDGVNGPRTFMSKKNNNTDLPTVKASWLWINNTAGSTIIDDAAFDGAVVNGNIVYYDSVSLTFKQALANGSTPQNAIGIADITNGRVFMSGSVPFLTGLTAGQIYYLSETTPGAITNIIPASHVFQIGFSKSSTELFLNIQDQDNTTVIQYGTAVYAIDTGAANAYVIALTPAITTYVDGMEVNVQIGAGNTNTAASTLNINGVGTRNILNLDGSAILPGQIIAGHKYKFIYNLANTSFLVNLTPDSFIRNIAVNGYDISPSGRITQWGKATLPGSGTFTSSVAVVFPIPFPNNAFNVVTSSDYPDSPGALMEVHPLSVTNSGFTAQGYGTGTIGADSNVYWQAIGN